ncbi:hypothetical protein B0J11DRAFT_428979 [Dendryphion nanum]|uniref:Uncharacterized protein n=1 Tax=Dendryphion nanum TaxID=256645 RepID=A0A9P9ITJ5_9PLEO|nr:hypothetical protein B0J11DRAFT_428979 [Dendryphion nanum]
MAEDRHHNFNRQSGKVNHGLDFGGAPSSDEDMQSSFDTPNPPLGIEFSTLIVPPVAPEPKITIKQLVAKLMNPSAHAFVYGVLSIGWVVGVAGYEHFEGKGADVQFSLRPESPLRKYGRKLGIPAGYHEWLCGDEDGTSATECGMMLTPEFFINEV